MRLRALVLRRQGCGVRYARTIVLTLDVMIALTVVLPAISRGRADFRLQTSTARADTSESTPRVIYFDVIAGDGRGRGVPDLRAADFELRDDGIPQSIDEARFITARPAGADEVHDAVDSDASERTAAADVHARLIGIFLD